MVPDTFYASFYASLVIAATQYDNAAAATRYIAVGDEDIVFTGATPPSNEFRIDLCTTGTAECDDFAAGLMWRQTNNPNASPAFSVETTPDSTVAPTIFGEAKILGIHLNPIADRLEIFP